MSIQMAWRVNGLACLLWAGMACQGAADNPEGDATGNADVGDGSSETGGVDAGPGGVDAGPGGVDAESDATGEADAGVEPDLFDEPNDPVPPIDEVLTPEACGDDYSPPGPRTTPGADLHLHTLDAPGAVCNDGSPGVMYLRAASDPAWAGEWVLHLQGGGSCDGDYAHCRARWCGLNDEDSRLMSTRFTAPTMGGNGILLRSEGNRFGRANQVFLYYCSSDWWTGQQSDVVLSDPSDPTQRYRLHFRGRTILEAALTELLDGAESDDGQVTLPPLAEAELVLVTGTSAGSAGVTHNLDAIASLFDPEQTRVVGVLDSFFPPALEALDVAIAEAVAGTYELEWEAAFVGSFGSFLDESCRLAHAETGDVWRCTTGDHLLLEHVTTPYFAWMSLADPVIEGRWYTPAGLTTPAFARGVRETLLAATAVGTDAEEAAAITVAPGVYGPGCAQHTGMMVNPRFYEATVEDETGTAWTFHDALGEWLDTGSFAAVDSVPPTASVCIAQTSP